MRFCNFHHPDDGVSRLPRAGVLLEGRIYELADLVREETGLRGDPDGEPLPLGFRNREGNNLIHLAEWREEVEAFGAQRTNSVESYDPEDLSCAPPVYHPHSFRDFYSFEQHVRTARKQRGLEMASEWYKFPVFYFSNHNGFIADGDELRAPHGGQWLDFELEVAAVVALPGKDLEPEEAERLIGGYCILNDWSLRDVQQQEVKVGLGPAKGKDFATSLGPWLVTPDEFENRRSGKGFDLRMAAYLNGHQISSGNWKEIHYSFGEMLARASADVRLMPGDVIGSGTVGNGCILELGSENTGGWLKPGDEVVLEIERLGRLCNTITAT